MITLRVSSTNYADDMLAIKKALSHMESLLGAYNGYKIGNKYEKFGWTFFEIAFEQDLQNGIEEKFADMLQRYRQDDPSQKFAKFINDYFDSKGCKARVSA